MSKIEWTEQTWNPIVGCSIVSPGCTNCYAMKMAARICNIHAGHALKKAAALRAGFLDYGTPEQREQERAILARRTTHYDGTIDFVKNKPVWTGKVALAPEHVMIAPLRRKKPTMYFVNSMGDLFHEDVPDEWIDRVFAVMALCPQHTFQILTKRSARMRDYMLSFGKTGWTSQRKYRVGDEAKTMAPLIQAVTAMGRLVDAPLANIWLGVSAERQQEADARVPDLLQTPAAVRFVSAEPLLGQIDFTRLDIPNYGYLNSLDDGYFADGRPPRRRLDWIIVGGESGHGARPMHPDWARSIRDQCAAAGVAFFFKQWGEWAPYDRSRTDGAALATANSLDAPSQRFGKKLSGRSLDGREHSDMPQQRELASTD